MYHVAFSYTSDAIACNLKQMLNVSFMYIVHLVNMNDQIFTQLMNLLYWILTFFTPNNFF